MLLTLSILPLLRLILSLHAVPCAHIPLPSPTQHMMNFGSVPDHIFFWYAHSPTTFITLLSVHISYLLIYTQHRHLKVSTSLKYHREIPAILFTTLPNYDSHYINTQNVRPAKCYRFLFPLREEAQVQIQG